MVALENSDILRTPTASSRIFLSLAGFMGVACALSVLIVLASNGFDETGLRLGSEMAWRFTFFAFFAALVVGPLARLLPFGPLRHLGACRRQVMWGFCACFAVLLASLLVPNTIRPVSVTHEGMTPGMALFVGFGAFLTVIMAYSIGRSSARVLGDKARRAVLTVGMSYFWLAYSLTGLARISGPHRPEIFYGLSVSLMVTALLLRFADRFVRKCKSLGPEGDAAEAL